jgi:glycosyltransferase involved in cell wall biosynthesis
MSPIISIVVPAYCEEGNLTNLYRELRQVVEPLGLIWELIIVDDGSTDHTWSEICLLSQQDTSVKGLRLSRNFGHQYAILAGLSKATGQAVITMDADLQHPPAAIPQLLEHWRNGSRIVHTVRIDHQNTPTLKKITSRLFYKVFSFLSGVHLSAGMVDFRLLDRQVVDAILQLKEGGLFLRGLIQWVGYPSSQVEFHCRERFSGKTKYPLRQMLKFAWTGITSFSLIPLRLAIIIGFGTSLVAFTWLIYAVWAHLFTNRTVIGWTSVVAFEALLFGILFILLGVIGEYLGRVLEEVRGRPRFIISEQTDFALPGARAVPVRRRAPAQDLKADD